MSIRPITILTAMIGLTIASAEAVTIDIPVLADGTATSISGPISSIDTDTTSPTAFTQRQSIIGSVDSRGVFVFDLSALPAGAVVTDASPLLRTAADTALEGPDMARCRECRTICPASETPRPFRRTGIGGLALGPRAAPKQPKHPSDHLRVTWPHLTEP